MIEVGKVMIDDSLYAGSDLYTDGSIEDIMLEIAKEIPRGGHNAEITKRKEWPILYHFSHLRENIVMTIPISKEDKVLEIGA